MCTLFYIALYTFVTVPAVYSAYLPSTSVSNAEMFTTTLVFKSATSLPAQATSNTAASTGEIHTSKNELTTKTTESPLKTTAVPQPPSPNSSGVAIITPHPPSGSSFNAGSFLGGMMLACILSLALMLGYKLVSRRSDVRYHTLEEHDAII